MREDYRLSRRLTKHHSSIAMKPFICSSYRYLMTSIYRVFYEGVGEGGGIGTDVGTRIGLFYFCSPREECVEGNMPPPMQSAEAEILGTN